MPLEENYMKKIVLTLIVLFMATSSYAQSITIFKGFPVVKISEGGESRVPEHLTKDKATNFKCIISKIDGSYYWTSRENIKLVRIDSGAFTTFLVENGSGYIRIVAPELKDAAALMSETEAKYDYVEHLLIGLRSVTYYGLRE
jgi:hypothetical protein